MSGIKQPVGQKRLTNVAIVRLKSHGKRFEIACYKNKVLNWREGIEKTLSEVIQIDTIFTNVSKGVEANAKDLQQAFGTTDSEEICKKILKSGDLQVSEREREVHLEGLFRDIVQIVVERCVHPQTGRQLTALAVESALRTVGFSVQPDHTAKRQALKAIESLCAEIPESFARAKMRLRISCPEALLDEIQRQIEERGQVEEVAGPGSGGPCSLTFLCDPSHYRELDRLATAEHAGAGVALHIVTAAALGVGEAPAGGTAAPAPAAAPAAAAPPAAAAQEAAPAGGGKRGPCCSACGGEAFEDAGEYRRHCRSEWHNHNLKRKIKGLAPVSELEFAEISLDIREGFLAVE